MERLCRGTSSWRRLAERRWRRDATSKSAAVGQVRRSLAVETVIHHRREFVLYSLRKWMPGFLIPTRNQSLCCMLCFRHLLDWLLAEQMSLPKNSEYRPRQWGRISWSRLEPSLRRLSRSLPVQFKTHGRSIAQSPSSPPSAASLY